MQALEDGCIAPHDWIVRELTNSPAFLPVLVCLTVPFRQLLGIVTVRHVALGNLGAGRTRWRVASVAGNFVDAAACPDLAVFRQRLIFFVLIGLAVIACPTGTFWMEQDERQTDYQFFWSITC